MRQQHHSGNMRAPRHDDDLSAARHSSAIGFRSARLRLALVLLIPAAHLRAGAHGFGLRSSTGAKGAQAGGGGAIGGGGARLKAVSKLGGGFLRLRQRDAVDSSGSSCGQASATGDAQHRCSADSRLGKCCVVVCPCAVDCVGVGLQ